MSSASVVFSPLKNDADSRKSEATGYYDLCMLSLAVKRWRNDCVQRQLPIETSSGLPSRCKPPFRFHRASRPDLLNAWRAMPSWSLSEPTLVWATDHQRACRAAESLASSRQRGGGVTFIFGSTSAGGVITPPERRRSELLVPLAGGSNRRVRLIRTSFLGGDVDNHQTENRCRGEIYPTYSPLHTALTSG